jgi:hypothetical protein
MERRESVHTHERGRPTGITSVDEHTGAFQKGESLFDGADRAREGERGEAIGGGNGSIEDVKRELRTGNERLENRDTLRSTGARVFDAGEQVSKRRKSQVARVERNNARLALANWGGGRKEKRSGGLTRCR